MSLSPPLKNPRVDQKRNFQYRSRRRPRIFSLHIGNDPSSIQDILDQGREGPGLDPLSFGHVMDEARMIDLQEVPLVNGIGVCLENQEPKVDGVSIEGSGIRLGDDGSDPRGHHDQRSDLHGRPTSKVPSCNQEITFFDLKAKSRANVLHQVSSELLGVYGIPFSARRNDVIRIDIIPKCMCNSHVIPSNYAKNSRGSVISPLTTEAARVAGEQR